MTTIEEWQAGKAVEGYPPFDGTGIPFPLGEDGIPDLPPGAVLSLTSVPAPGDLPAGTGINFTATSATPLADGLVELHMSVDGGAFSMAGMMSGPPGSTSVNGASTPGAAAGSTVAYKGVNPENTAVVSDVLTFTIIAASADPSMGWTKAELIQFAADHEPPIEIPSSGTKADILAAILAYIESHPEEN